MPKLLSWENDEPLIHLLKNDYGPNSFHDTPYDIYILPDDSAKEWTRMFNNCKPLDFIGTLCQIAMTIGFIVIVVGVIWGIAAIVKWLAWLFLF